MLWQRFKSIIFFCIRSYIPTKIKRTKKHNPWINREIIHAKRKVKRLRKLLKKKPNFQTRLSLTSAITSMKSKIKAAKTFYLSNTLTNFLKKSPQKFWNYLSPKSQSGNTMSREESNERANLMNNYFKSIFTNDDTTPCHVYSHSSDRIDTISLNEAGILNLLLKLDCKKKAGPDDIPNEFLRRYAEWMAKYLFLIFNKSLTTCSLPSEWKMAKVIPIHKGGNKTDASNYRPISLTSTTCKLLEHIILKHITTYVEKKKFYHHSSMVSAQVFLQ